MGKYRTIVADPPWEMPTGPQQGSGIYLNEGTDGRKHRVSHLAYSQMTVDEVRELPVANLAEDEAHLYLWTTNRHLRFVYEVAEAWGFRPATVLVWSKPPMGFVGTWVCSTEFCLFARKGTLTAKRKHSGTCLEFPRGPQSAKPEAFLDLIEEISPGPYLEMFARRARFGWDYWGDESLQTAELSA